MENFYRKFSESNQNKLYYLKKNKASKTIQRIQIFFNELTKSLLLEIDLLGALNALKFIYLH